MAELDADLSARLSRLAAAVPVASGQLDVVHRDAVRARQQVRMAWLTPLVVLVVGVVAASTLQIGPFAPGATPQPSGPATATTRDGDFMLSIEATKGTYLEGEPIDISASLAYDGGESTVISHGSAAGGSPIGFGIDEPIFGAARLGPLWETGCTSTTLAGDSPLTVPFEKTADTSQPGFGELDIFMLDPQLHLNPGTWHLYANARFRLGDCLTPSDSSAAIELRVQLEITVVPRPGETPLPSDGSPPGPTIAPSAQSPASPMETAATGDRWQSETREGDYELSIAAAKPTFSSDEPLEVTASLTYWGAEERISIFGSWWGPITFLMQRAPGITLYPVGPSVCNEIELVRGVPYFQSLVHLSGDPHPFAVPHGLHEIGAFAAFSTGRCDAGTAELRSSIVVAVSEGDDDIPIWTDPTPEDVCLLMFGGGRLTADADSGLGVVDATGTFRVVIWPADYSARREPDGAVLLAPDGKIVARVGDRVLFDAIMHVEGPVHPCGPVSTAAP